MAVRLDRVAGEADLRSAHRQPVARGRDLRVEENAHAPARGRAPRAPPPLGSPRARGAPPGARPPRRGRTLSLIRRAPAAPTWPPAAPGGSNVGNSTRTFDTWIEKEPLLGRTWGAPPPTSSSCGLSPRANPQPLPWSWNTMS